GDIRGKRGVTLHILYDTPIAAPAIIGDDLGRVSSIMALQRAVQVLEKRLVAVAGFVLPADVIDVQPIGILRTVDPIDDVIDVIRRPHPTSEPARAAPGQG